MLKKGTIVCKCNKQTQYGIKYFYDPIKEIKEIFIDSCCGQCAAAQDIRYCPYCAKELRIL